MGTFRLRDLLSNKALTDTSVRAPSGPLCSTLMTCHSCRTTRKPSKLKLWPTAKEALCTLETLMAVSEYTAYQSFLKCRNYGRTTWERGPGKGRERVRNEERTERQKWKCKTTGLSCPQGQLRVKKKGIYMLSVEGFWIWPWNISNLIFCTLLSSLPYPTFLGQMLSKPMGLAPSNNSLVSGLLETLSCPSFSYTNFILFPSNLPSMPLFFPVITLTTSLFLWPILWN